MKVESKLHYFIKHNNQLIRRHVDQIRSTNVEEQIDSYSNALISTGK